MRLSSRAAGAHGMGAEDIHVPPDTLVVRRECERILSPVSYTHLDVYKRQAIDRYGPLEGSLINTAL